MALTVLYVPCSLRVSSCGVRGSVLGFRVQGFGFRVSSCGVRLWGLGSRLPDGDASERRGNNLNRVKDFFLKARAGPVSGLDCLMCALFARQREIRGRTMEDYATHCPPGRTPHTLSRYGDVSPHVQWTPVLLTVDVTV